ncbi:MAG: isoprenylcysteine carboxylmethyltransferase family protein [bacterium]
MIFNLILYPGIILFLSGDWYWLEGWIFALWFIISVISTTLYLTRKSPGLLQERFRKPGTGGQKGWDKYFMYLLVLANISWYMIMPLDAKRFGWTAPFPIWFKGIGGVGLLGSYYFIFRSIIANPFASGLVRIQSERNHQLVSTGVYGMVRHPMYLGGIMLFLGAPLLLSSKYGIVIGIGISLMFIFRIYGEEKMLDTELPGYPEYKLKVKYRLIPKIW